MTPEASASTAPPDHSLPPSAPPPRKRRHRWVWAVVLIAFGLLFYWVISQHRKSEAAAMGGGRRGMSFGPVPVVPAKVTTGNLGVYLQAIGTVTPIYTDSITAQVTGVIQSVHYREGQEVKQGDPLVDIDPAPYQATLEQAQGALQRDQALLAEAQMDLKRYQLAWSKNAIPRQTLEDQEKLVAQYQGTVKNDQGLVQYDQVQVGFCHITSPITGKVGLRLVDPGNLVTANSTATLVVVTQMRPITVIFTLAEDSLPQVLAQMRKGKALTVEAWDRAFLNKLATGRLLTVDNQIDTTTGTVKLRAEFANPQETLFPNEFVNTKMLVTTEMNQIVVPASAIQHNGDQAYVYLIEPGPGAAPGGGTGSGATPATGGTGHGSQPNPNGGSAQGGGNQGGGAAPSPAGGQGNSHAALYHVVMTTVKTGITDNNMTAVQGLKVGQQVANSSFQRLIDGSTVTMSNVVIPSTETSISGESGAP